MHLQVTSQLYLTQSAGHHTTQIPVHTLICKSAFICDTFKIDEKPLSAFIPDIDILSHINIKYKERVILKTCMPAWQVKAIHHFQLRTDPKEKSHSRVGEFDW